MKKQLAAICAALGVLLWAAAAFAQEEDKAGAAAPAAPPLLAMKLENGALTGPGAQALLARLPKAQFVLIGEEHGFADTPRLALALARAGRKYGLTHHVVETGPLSEEWAGDVLRKAGVDGLARALAGRPLALPFLTMREDAELAHYFVAGARRGADALDALWGVDQEFIGSPLIHFETLAGLAPDKEAKALALSLLKAEREAFAAGNQGAFFLFRAQAEDFARLRAAFGKLPRAAAIVAALEESAGIYQSFGAGKNYASNADRIALIRRNFLAACNKAGKAPRALFKMGAIHLGRGTTFLNTFDLGSLTEGIAAANGLDVLRILYFPVSGRVTQVKPSAKGAFETVDYGEDEMIAALASLGVTEEMIAADGFTVIPLEPVRLALEQEGLSGLPEESRFFLLGYDFLVTTRNAQPATPLAE